MDRKNICRLCLVSKNEILELYGAEGIQLNVTQILVQHFWFQINQDDNLPIGICRNCWQYVNEFHEFYKNIEFIHKNYYDNLQFQNYLNIKTETTDLNNDYASFNHSSIEIIEPIAEIKIEEEKNVSDVKIKRNVSTKSLKSPTKSSKTVKSDNRTEKNNTKEITKKIINKNITNDCKKQKSVEETVNDISNHNIIEVKKEFNKSNHTLNINDCTDNKTNVKTESLDKRSQIAAENIQIREFFNLMCEICSSQHSTLLALKKHYNVAHNSKNGYVLCCKKKLFERGRLLEHMLWHTNPDKFRCPFCYQIYANKRALNIHMHFHSTPEERKYVCDICNASFTVRYLLMRHFRKIHLTQNNIEFKCNLCDKSFNKNSKLQCHIRGVHEYKNLHICEICAKVYKSKSQCQIHYLEEHVNANKPKLKCKLCDSMLKNESSLKFHLRRKHFEKPVSCKLCNKISPNTHALKKHIRDVHSERKHKCSLCDKAFKRPIGLKEHMATHSSNSYLYTCPYCTTSFNSDANMYSHRKRKHPVEWLEERQRRLGITTANNYQNKMM